MMIVDAPCPQPTSATRAPFARASRRRRRAPGSTTTRGSRCSPARKKRSVPQKRSGSCSCQPTPLPGLERHSTIVSRSFEHARVDLEAAEEVRGARLVGERERLHLVQRERAGGPRRSRRSSAAPPARASHSRTYRSSVRGLRFASSAGVTRAGAGECLVESELVADADERAPSSVAPRSPTSLPRNSSRWESPWDPPVRFVDLRTPIARSRRAARRALMHEPSTDAPATTGAISPPDPAAGRGSAARLSWRTPDVQASSRPTSGSAERSATSASRSPRSGRVELPASIGRTRLERRSSAPRHAGHSRARREQRFELLERRARTGPSRRRRRARAGASAACARRARSGLLGLHAARVDDDVAEAVMRAVVARLAPAERGAQRAERVLVDRAAAVEARAEERGTRPRACRRPRRARAARPRCGRACRSASRSRAGDGSRARARA